MKTRTTFFHCGEHLQKTLVKEISDIESVVSQIGWSPSFQYSVNGFSYEHQAAYNKAFSTQFVNLGWEHQPLLRSDPKLIGDFRKGVVFVEVQFGNSSTLYRDYYKFQYGLANGDGGGGDVLKKVNNFPFRMTNGAIHFLPAPFTIVAPATSTD